jgi:hypothetical protein
MEGVTFSSPTNSPGTDAIDLTQCRHVNISRCISRVGGEGIAIQSTRPFAGRSFSSEDIVLDGCNFSGGRGLSIGSQTMGGVRHVVIKNCILQDMEGIHFKSSRDKGGITEDVICQDIVMTNVKSPITITCYNQGFKKDDAAQAVGEFTPVFRNIRFKNITAAGYHSAGMIAGLPESAIKDVTFENVKISAPAGMKLSNARAIQFKNTRIACKHGSPLLMDSSAEIFGETNLLLQAVVVKK